MQFIGIALRLLVVVVMLVLLSSMMGRILPHAYEIAYTAYDSVNPDIYRMDVFHHLRYNLTRREGYDANPSWSPDGHLIAFTSDRQGPLRVFVMDALGRDVRAIVDVQGATFGARWSEDGEYLYFFRFVSQNQEIYRVRLDGTGFEQVTEAVQSQRIQMNLDVEPGGLGSTRSPDGTQNLFIAFREGNWGIYLSDQQRTNARRLADAGRQYNELPVWSRDGKQVAFIALMQDGVDIYMVNADPNYAMPRRLTFDRNVEAGISWRP